MEATVSIIGGFATLFGIVYYFLATRHKERMALLQTGADPNVFKATAKNNLFLLCLGLVSIGLALGIAGGYWLEGILINQHAQEIAAIRQHKPHFKPSYPEAYLMNVFFFVGLSLVLSYFISRKSDKTA